MPPADDEARDRATKTAPASSDPPSPYMPRLSIKPRGIGCLFITWMLGTALVAVAAVHIAQRYGWLR